MPVYTVHAPSVDGTDVRGTTDNSCSFAMAFRFGLLCRSGVAALSPALAGARWISGPVDHGGSAVTLLRGGEADTHCGDGSDRHADGFGSGEFAALDIVAAQGRQLDIVVADDEEAAERRFSIAGRRSGVRTSIRRRRSRRATADPNCSGPAVLVRRRCRAATLSACFRNPEFRGERCDHRLWLRQPALGREGVRARGAQHGGIRKGSS